MHNHIEHNTPVIDTITDKAVMPTTTVSKASTPQWYKGANVAAAKVSKMMNELHPITMR